jgi:hypothetical protein
MCVVVGSVTILVLILWNIEPEKPTDEELSDTRQCCGLVPSKRQLSNTLIKVLVGDGKNVGEAAPVTRTAKISLFLLDAFFLTLIGNLLSVLVCKSDATGLFSCSSRAVFLAFMEACLCFRRRTSVDR